jgi:hypothetical protein
MSWLSDRREKRADKAATKEYNRLHAIWQEDVATLTEETSASVGAI